MRGWKESQSMQESRKPHDGHFGNAGGSCIQPTWGEHIPKPARKDCNCQGSLEIHNFADDTAKTGPSL